ncbi:MAG TPA: MFS transporter [Methylophilaceae bacterium]|nr:MFS transporter [Methylophilaceae bacterium]HQR60056.1 MFS transporter [Methylophilaceae bacterium]
MTPLELRATVALALVFALRMFGMFSILPVLAIYAQHLPGGASPFLVGIALGIDGLAQAFLQIPFGLLSDRYGRKRVIYAGLALFALGSFIAAGADNIHMIILGRLVQGTGAIAAAVIALTADLTREEHRSKAMAVIGMSIGVTFGASMVAGPALAPVIGVSGIFAMTGVLALLAMAVVRFVVPDPRVSHVHADAETVPGQIAAVLKNPELQRLDFGIFSLHAAMRGLFVVVPLALLDIGGLAVNEHWKVYLPVMAISFLAVIPVIIIGETRGKMKPVFCGAVALLLLSMLLMAVSIHNFHGVLASLFLFFLAFNLLEATLPSLVSKIAPAGSKGTAIGVYNSFQFFGLFLGGALGGFLAQHVGGASVFVFAAGLCSAWLLLALSMQTPPAVRTRMYHVNTMDAAGLSAQLGRLDGVVEAVVDADEGVAYLKVRLGEWDETGARNLIEREE